MAFHSCHHSCGWCKRARMFLLNFVVRFRLTCVNRFWIVPKIMVALWFIDPSFLLGAVMHSAALDVVLRIMDFTYGGCSTSCVWSVLSGDNFLDRWIKNPNFISSLAIVWSGSFRVLRAKAEVRTTQASSFWEIWTELILNCSLRGGVPWPSLSCLEGGVAFLAFR